MKTTIFFLIGLLVIPFCNFSYCNNENNEAIVTKSENSPAGSLTIQCSPDLYNLTSRWVSEYGKLNPGFNASIFKSAGIDDRTVQSSEGNLFFLSDGSTLKNDMTWRMVIGRDVIVPVINSSNPLLKEINEQGISSDDLLALFRNQESPQWSILLQNGKGIPLHYYKINDESVNAGLAAYLYIDKIPDIGINVNNSAEMIGLIQKDPNGLGFCRIKDLMDPNNQTLADNIKLLPIDKNGNGRIDNFEKIYSSQDAFMRGVWLGKYPFALSNSIYSVSSAKPLNETAVAFLKWILTDGQQYLNQNGYVDLVESERDTKVELLAYNQISAKEANAGNPVKTTIFILFLIVVTGFVVAILYRYIRIKKQEDINTSPSNMPVFDENSIVVPKGVYFDKSHTWAFMEVNGDVRIGVDDFLQHITGPITRTKMKEPGEMVKKGEHIFSLIQNGKQLTIHSPVSGKIIVKNEALATDSSSINASPYSDGWVYLIEPTNWLRETQFMIMAERYSEWLRYEFTRLKDFFSISLRANKTEYAHVVLQDGGNIHDNILAEFGPEVWEDFQTNFIEASK